MIDKRDLVEIGKFQKTHALKGELNALLDIPEEYVEEGNPLIVEMDGIPVPFYADTVRPKGATSYLIKLEGIDTQEEAQGMVNSVIYAPKSKVTEYLAEEGEEFLFNDDLGGFRVIDDILGEIGKVDRIDDSTQNVLMVVEREDGMEIFIPLVEDFINEINDEDGIIYVNIPEGLVNLNE